MDNIVVKTVKYRNLERTSHLSSLQLLEDNEYIKLAMCFEQYLANPVDEQLDIMKEQFSICKERFPNYVQIRQELVGLLMNLGYMKVDNQEQIKSNPNEPTMVFSDTELSSSTEEPIKSNKQTNVVSIFTKKPPVD